MKKWPFILLLCCHYLSDAQQKDHFKTGEYQLPNTVAPLDYEDHQVFRTNATDYIPIEDTTYSEHVRTPLGLQERVKVNELFNAKNEHPTFSGQIDGEITCTQRIGKRLWIGTQGGLYYMEEPKEAIIKYPSYGVNGPLATEISDMALDSKGNLWIGTPIGISLLKPDGSWSSIRGTEGLPVEDVRALVVTSEDHLWIGTSQGAVWFKPDDLARQWYYRAGKRYLINDMIKDISISEDGRSVYFMTADGVSKIEAVKTTLAQKAARIEDKVDTWHRRMGLVAACELDQAEDPTTHRIHDNDNDGLWTSYHVVAMSLAYATTGDVAYLESARKGMHAMILLQNASGIPGLVARSVVPYEESVHRSSQWRTSSDGKLLWKSDTSNDEIDGHFFAFYAYWEHIAKHDTLEANLIRRQVSTLMNYIVDHNYQLIDWHGRRTTWGFWNPELLNDDPHHYLENGLNAAQILSFLKVSHYITGNEKFRRHYEHLIVEHGYLGNVLLEKKVFPDNNNHSDNQLGFVALYPLIQLERSPKARNALQRAVRRHYLTLRRDGSAFFYFAAATIDPDYVDIKAAVRNLHEIPTDRRQWKMINSHRKDIQWSPIKSRFGKDQLLHVLPGDERNFDRWNRNPYYPDGGRGGQFEDDGGSWLLGYWMGRFHGFIGAGA